MPTLRSPAEQLDRAVDQLIAGDAARATLDPALRSLLEVAGLLRGALVPVPAGRRFDERLASRLSRAARPGSPHALTRRINALGDATRRELRHPGRLLVTGALSSAAVGVGVTAYAVWRGSRRPARAGHRLMHG